MLLRVRTVSPVERRDMDLSTCEGYFVVLIMVLME